MTQKKKEIDIMIFEPHRGTFFSPKTVKNALANLSAHIRTKYQLHYSIYPVKVPETNCIVIPTAIHLQYQTNQSIASILYNCIYYGHGEVYVRLSKVTHQIIKIHGLQPKISFQQVTSICTELANQSLLSYQTNFFIFRYYYIQI